MKTRFANVAELLMTLYGVRDAGQNFKFLVAEIMVELGFVKGVYTPCAVHPAEMQVYVVVRGDDFIVLGTRSATAWFKDGLSKRIIVKGRGVLGPNRKLGDVPEIRVLNRIIRWRPTRDMPRSSCESSDCWKEVRSASAQE